MAKTTVKSSNKGTGNLYGSAPNPAKMSEGIIPNISSKPTTVVGGNKSSSIHDSSGKLLPGAASLEGKSGMTSGPYITSGGSGYSGSYGMGPSAQRFAAGTKAYFDAVKGSAGDRGPSRAGGSFSASSGGNAVDLAAFDTLGRMVSEEGARLERAYTDFKGFAQNILRDYSVTPANIQQANTQIGALMSNPEAILNNPIYSGAMNQATNAITRQLVAQGYNPAESGFGAAALGERASQIRLDTLNSVMGHYMNILGQGTQLAQGGLGMFGNLAQSYVSQSPQGMQLSGQLISELARNKQIRQPFNLGNLGIFNQQQPIFG